ncbi:hypothetical protein [Chryseobacterium sp. 18068]|uniref:hypothetical protein n=1 Tax=Chryseobacterium sp. 18068 TaxID=2681414 RepID=UPI0013570FCA|nr:hypothetical protein [Chryseobacterium sp. 18068]
MEKQYLDLSNPNTQLIGVPSLKSKSFNVLFMFYAKYNLSDLEDAELFTRLNEIVQDENILEEDRNFAKSLLNNKK